MLDVHAPHERIHGWRDFLLHIATITIGLLIAIGLEQTVEWFHHRHLVHQAREQLHEEMVENRRTLSQDQQFLQKTAVRGEENIAILDEKDQIQANTMLHFGWQWNGLQSSAWQTARDTGAITLMSYQDVQAYSETYSQQGLVTANADAYVQMYARSVSPLFRHGGFQNGTVAATQLSSAEREQLAASSAETLTQVGLLLDLLRHLDKNYADTLAQTP